MTERKSNRNCYCSEKNHKQVTIKANCAGCGRTVTVKTCEAGAERAKRWLQDGDWTICEKCGRCKHL